MFTDFDDSTSVQVGTMINIVDIFVVLLLLFAPTSLAQLFISEPPLPPQSAEIESMEPAAQIVIGPGDTILYDNRECDLSSLRTALAQLPGDQTVALTARTPVDYSFAYRVRYAVRATGVTLHELPPAQPDH